jgi:hypothetical protein
MPYLFFLQLTPNDSPSWKLISQLSLEGPVRWNSRHSWASQDKITTIAVRNWLMKRPWQCYLGGSQKFLGYEQAWDTLLGALVYCKTLHIESFGRKNQPSGEGSNGDENLQPGALQPIIQEMLDMIKQLTELFSWPGIPPSLCYSVATSRGAYLLSLWDWGPYEELVRLAASCLVRCQLPSVVDMPQKMV